jgi:hypothetical protein
MRPQSGEGPIEHQLVKQTAVVEERAERHRLLRRKAVALDERRVVHKLLQLVEPQVDGKLVGCSFEVGFQWVEDGGREVRPVLTPRRQLREDKRNPREQRQDAQA